MDDVVALVKHRGDLSVASRTDSLRQAIQLIGGFGNLQSPFVVKVNLCTHPSWDVTKFATTNVRMVEALLQLALKEKEHLSVKIVESDSNNKFANEETFKKFGYKDLEERYRGLGHDVSLVSLSQPPMSKFAYDGKYFGELEVHELLTKPKYFASLSMPKIHSATYMTGTIKNMFGLLPKKRKIEYPHASAKFCDLILDMARYAKLDLCIIDAIVGLEGPFTGRPRRLNAIIVGRKPLSVDSTMARLMGFEPENIRLLVEGEKLGLGSMHPKVVGESPESMKVQFRIPAKLGPAALP
jgi:uncharacterized protein (DUF362 family)